MANLEIQQQDRDAQFIKQKEMSAIYADERGQKKCLAMIKMVLDRRKDLNSIIYNELIKTV